MDMDPKNLRAFYYVGRYGSVLKAANFLKVSSPAISVQLKKLEKELQLKLFERYPNKIVLTDTGRIILDKAELVFDALGQLKTAASQTPEMDPETLTIALGSDLPKFLAPRIAAFTRRHPALRLTIISRPSETLSLLVADEVDVAIGWFPKIPRTLEKKLLFKSKMHLIFPRNHTLARKKTVMLSDTAAFRLILQARSVAARRVIDAAFHTNGIEIENTLEVGTCDAIKEFVRLGLGIGFVHDICLPMERKKTICSVDMSGEIDAIDVSLIYKKSTFRKSSYRALIESLITSRGTGDRN